MPSGAWPPEAVERLEYMGDWLQVNGEAIYGTRPYAVLQEGDDLWFTSSKDGRTVYAISLKWPGKTLTVRSAQPRPGSSVQMLGVSTPLRWERQGDSVTVHVPGELAEHKPCKQAYVVRFQAQQR